jgi:hypothetical protein
MAAPLGGADAVAAPKSKTTQAAATPTASATGATAKSGAARGKEAQAADPEAIAAKRDPQYTSATGSGTATDEGCLRQRKRLWVEGEGWLVRKVTVCP